MPRDKGYTTKSSGTNSRGNHYCARDYGSSAANSNSYHYSNRQVIPRACDVCLPYLPYGPDLQLTRASRSGRDGSYYYSNSNGSSYHNNGAGGSTYTTPSGSKYTSGK